jgi:hypothetical protein
MVDLVILSLANQVGGQMVGAIDIGDPWHLIVQIFEITILYACGGNKQW